MSVLLLSDKQTKETWETMKYLTFHDNRPRVIWSFKKTKQKTKKTLHFRPNPRELGHLIQSASRKPTEHDQIGKHFCINCIVRQSRLPASVICLWESSQCLAIHKGDMHLLHFLRWFLLPVCCLERDLRNIEDVSWCSWVCMDHMIGVIANMEVAVPQVRGC